MNSFLAMDGILRGFEWGQGRGGRLPAFAFLLALITVWGLFYGGVMGTYGGIEGQRCLQVAYSGLKVPVLLLVTSCLSLPSFFVVSTLFGLRLDFEHSIRALLSGQAAVTMVLAALAPYTMFWYASGSGYREAILFNFAIFGIAALAGQSVLLRSYRPLIRRNPRHRWMLLVWMVVYGFVGIQMAWLLRPFIGDPTQPVQFFRADAWGNAYVVLFHLIWR